jgi:hypothetical protein
MHWFDIDGARDHLASKGGRRPSRKVIYGMVTAGMRVAPRGDTGRRFWFCAEWMDEFLIRRSNDAAKRGPRAIDTPAISRSKDDAA